MGCRWSSWLTTKTTISTADATRRGDDLRLAPALLARLDQAVDECPEGEREADEAEPVGPSGTRVA